MSEVSRGLRMIN